MSTFAPMDSINTTPPSNDWSWLWALVAATVTQFVNWMFNRRKEAKELEKAASETQSAELDNIEKAVAIWRKLAEEMNQQVVEMKAQSKLMGEEIEKLRIENVTLKQSIEELRLENSALKQQISELRSENDTLKTKYP